MEPVPKSIGRLLLEQVALRQVCSCLYYDLADNIDSAPSGELLDIINDNHHCPLCGK